jgi:hypothetical protein
MAGLIVGGEPPPTAGCPGWWTPKTGYNPQFVKSPAYAGLFSFYHFRYCKVTDNTYTHPGLTLFKEIIKRKQQQ